MKDNVGDSCSSVGWDMTAGQSLLVLSPFTNRLSVRLTAEDVYHEAATYLTSDLSSGWHRLGFQCLTTWEDWQGDFRQTLYQAVHIWNQICVRACGRACVCVCVNVRLLVSIGSVRLFQCLYWKANVCVVISKFLLCVSIIILSNILVLAALMWCFCALWAECADIPLYTLKHNKWNRERHSKSRTDSVNTSIDEWPPAFWSHLKHFFLHLQAVRPCLFLWIPYSLLFDSYVFCSSSFPFPFPPFLHVEVH